MLEGSKKAKLQECPEEIKEYLMEVLLLIDSVEQTIYSKEFYYIYVDQRLYSTRKLTNILNLSYTTLHIHMRKLNKFIKEATIRMKVRQ